MAGDSGDYKTLKEAFVSDGTGSSIGHVNMVSLVALVYVSFVRASDRALKSS